MKNQIAVLSLTALFVTGSALAQTPQPAPSPAIKSIAQRVTIASDGSAKVEGNIELANLRAGSFSVPMPAWGDVQLFQATGGPEGLRSTAAFKGANPSLVLTVPEGGLPALALKLSFTAPSPPKGASDYRIVSHRILNTTMTPIERYRAEMLLPQDEVVHSVTEALPRQRATETTPRVQLAEINGRHGAVLNVTNLRFAEAASAQLEAEQGKRSLIPLMAGVLLSGLFLFGFRGLLRKDGNNKKVA